ncbi:hypothetical protein DLP05_127 [Stenotrophomonas phage vB_SmaS_DLP_5]|uniref:Uncharacterized protein n=1 Tax=Stenotrophomonas phage vB_SmaS_DLP_5 TaxID=2044561 RepID=A0A2D2W2Z8_9CAUD|nr:hypothetical protein FDJ07_gp094 [Stenotrophomonas phage vB_SmaS_DLP_5]ATS92356.1 hypothetical protein DLP05_127 [Stenotrophomonas phage vB_SmaS_DLP_5]
MIKVGIAGNLPGTNGGFTQCAFHATEVPEGTDLFIKTEEDPTLLERYGEAFQLGLTHAIIADLLKHIDKETCTHEETHRGGAIWTICDSCGRKWADDEGGFQPHKDDPAVAQARKYMQENGYMRKKHNG